MLTKRIREVFINYSENCFWRHFWFWVFPAILSALAIIFVDITEKENAEPISSVLLTIFSIFIGFFISLILFLNNKVFSFKTAEMKNSDDKSYAINYINFCRKLTNRLIYGIVLSCAVIICLLIPYINIKGIYFGESGLTALSFIMNFASISFILLLFRIISYMAEALVEDIRNKKEQIEDIKF